MDQGPAAEELLQYASSQGMIDISYVQEALEMSEREQCLQAHPYKIWEGKDGKWYTYLPKKDKGRILKKKSTRKAIEDVVVSYWREQTDSPTVEEIFAEWNARRMELGKISRATYNRYQQDFDRYFVSMGKRKIRNLDPDEIEVFLEDQLCEFNLTAKAFSNLKTITKGFLKYAKKKKYISFAVEELFDDMDVSDRVFRQVIREDYEEVFDEEETELIIRYLEENLDIQNLGILLLFVTGMRIGELVTLKHEDIDGNAIRIRRTETYYTDEDGNNVHAVKEFPKSKAGVRTAVIPRDFTWLLDELAKTNPDAEYIFMNRGKRLTTNSIRGRLRRVCKKLDIYQKSPHKIRKTYGSILLDNNVDKRLVTELMGHSNIFITETHYHRNRRSIDEKVDRISEIPEFRTK